MFTLEGNMTSKGLKFDGVVLRVASPTSLQRNLSRSKALSTPGPITFTLIDFLQTNNAEMEIAAFLEQRFVDANVNAQIFSARKEMLLTFGN